MNAGFIRNGLQDIKSETEQSTGNEPCQIGLTRRYISSSIPEISEKINSNHMHNEATWITVAIME